jgi:hypothetical protein
MLEQIVNLSAILLVPFGCVFPAHSAWIEHPVTQQPVVPNRQETRLMRPVFEQRAFCEMFVEPLLRIRPKTAEQHQIRTARDDMDRIDLQLRHAPNRIEHVGFGSLAARRRKQALRGQMKGARSGEGECLHAVSEWMSEASRMLRPQRDSFAVAHGQQLMDLRDNRRTFADRGRDAFGRAGARIANCEHAIDARAEIASGVLTF